MDGTRSSSWERTIGVASLVSGGIHAAVFKGHVEEWWVHGIFFLVVALAQIVFGLAALTHAIQEQYFGPGADRANRWMWTAAIVGNALIMAIYVVSRTVGVPVGPEAGVPEPVGILDVLSKVAEAVVIVGCLVLLSGPAKASRPGRS